MSRAASIAPIGLIAPIAALAGSDTVPTAQRNVSLFSRDALEHVVGRAGSGDSDRAESPNAETKRRVDAWIGAASRRADVDAGRVDPAYRVLARALNDEFHPPAAVVNVHGWGGAIHDEIKAFVLDADRGSALPWRPVWLEAEVEVDLDSTGTPQKARLAKSSGFGPFDHYALVEVDRISGHGHHAIPHAATLTFRIRGSYVAKAPLNYYGFTFDNHGVHGANPLGEVQSDITLLAVRATP